MKNQNEDGFSEYRFENNPKEKAFADAWLKLNKWSHTLEYLISGEINVRSTPTPEQIKTANMIVQWMGSPCGQVFIKDVDESLNKK